MVSVRKRGKVYEYRFETASVDGTRKWISKSGFPTRQDALNQGALDYTEYYKIGRVRRNKDMSYSDYLDYLESNYIELLELIGFDVEVSYDRFTYFKEKYNNFMKYAVASIDYIEAENSDYVNVCFENMDLLLKIVLDMGFIL